MSTKAKYILSFTAASLMVTDSVKIAELYLHSLSWIEVKRRLFEENLLQSRTNSRSVRVIRELIQRLQELSSAQLELLVDGDVQEQKYLMWLAVCKRYRLIKEFGIQVIHEKFLGMNYQITEFDYDAFFHHQADQFEELGNITDSTRKKLKQVIFLMIREAGLVNEDLVLGETLLSLQLKEVLKPDTPMSFLIFPTRNQAAQDDQYE